jgi:hypothetical protein
MPPRLAMKGLFALRLILKVAGDDHRDDDSQEDERDTTATPSVGCRDISGDGSALGFSSFN